MLQSSGTRIPGFMQFSNSKISCKAHLHFHNIFGGILWFSREVLLHPATEPTGSFFLSDPGSHRMAVLLIEFIIPQRQRFFKNNPGIFYAPPSDKSDGSAFDIHRLFLSRQSAATRCYFSPSHIWQSFGSPVFSISQALTGSFSYPVSAELTLGLSWITQLFHSLFRNKPVFFIGFHSYLVHRSQYLPFRSQFNHLPSPMGSAIIPTPWGEAM